MFCIWLSSSSLHSLLNGFLFTALVNYVTECCDSIDLVLSCCWSVKPQDTTSVLAGSSFGALCTCVSRLAIPMHAFKTDSHSQHFLILPSSVFLFTDQYRRSPYYETGLFLTRRHTERNILSPNWASGKHSELLGMNSWCSIFFFGKHDSIC